MGTPSDLDLLRAYEPILAFTEGELFFPTDVEGYLASCSLWRDLPGGSEEEVLPVGAVTVERLVRASRDWPGVDLHLRFVQEASLRAEARRFKRTAKPVIPRSGRLAAVGVFGRIIDVLMRLSLLIRGAVPGGVAHAAATRYRDRLDRDPTTATYYGRVVREAGYIALQYWYFYAMNDWRSTFGGVNDHEADWEKVTVYLADNGDGTVEPAWVGASSHEYTGDDLRRSWADPDLRSQGEHPIVFVGAGSHSHQMLPGDYLIQVDPSFLRSTVRAWRGLAARLLPGSRSVGRHGIGIPFVDYARGDGVRVGPGQDREWRAVVIDEDTPWISGYRGLWGRDTRDWFEGERAPSGPAYERDGTPRRSWTDPLNWVGLHKVPPGAEAARQSLDEHMRDLRRRIEEADAAVESGREEARRLSAAAASLEAYAHTRTRAREYRERAREADGAVARAHRERALLTDELATHREAREDRSSFIDPPKAHLSSPHLPYASGEQRHTRLAQLWVALSTPLLIVALASLLFVPGPAPLAAAVGVVLLFAAVDAFVRRRLRSFLAGVAVFAVIAGVTAGIIWAFVLDWRISVMVPLMGTVLVLLVANLRDLLRG